MGDYGFEYIVKNKGITTESSYPYTAQDGACKTSVKSAVTITGHTDVQSPTRMLWPPPSTRDPSLSPSRLTSLASSSTLAEFSLAPAEPSWTTVSSLLATDPREERTTGRSRTPGAPPGDLLDTSSWRRARAETDSAELLPSPLTPLLKCARKAFRLRSYL